MYLRTRDPGYQWQTALVDRHMMLAAELATSGWVPASMFTAKWRWRAGSIDAHPIPNDLIVFAEPPKDSLMDALPNAGLHPFMKSTPAGHSTAASRFARQILTRYSGPEYEQNASQCCSITDAWATSS